MMKVLITGSVAFDYLMTFPGYFKEQFLPERLENISLSFLVDSMTRQRGGIAPNIAYTMALLGERPRVMAMVGEDFDEYRSWLESKGVDTNLMHVAPNTNTASFFATTDLSNAQIASFYPGAMGFAAEQSIRNLEDRPDLVVISPNSPEAMTKFAAECRDLQIPYLYDPSQQILRLDGNELSRDMDGAHFLFVNDYEFGLISKKTGLDLSKMLEHVEVIVITRGKKGSSVYAAGKEYNIPVVPEVNIVDPTGVGDSYRAGFLTGYVHNWGWELCGQLGSMAATYCLEHKGTQNHSFTRAEFIKRFRNYFDDKGVLETLFN
jgi:adenosine kinase